MAATVQPYTAWLNATPRAPLGTTTDRVHVCILSYNALPMVSFTVAHYRRMLPKSLITLLDNNSTDGACVQRSTWNLASVA